MRRSGAEYAPDSILRQLYVSPFHQLLRLQLTPRDECPSEETNSPCLVKSHLMEPEDSLPCSLKPATYPYREPVKFSPRPPIQFLEQDLFDIYHKPIKYLMVACNTTLMEPICWGSNAELCFLSQLIIKIQNWCKVKFHHTGSTIKRLLKRSRFNVRYSVLTAENNHRICDILCLTPCCEGEELCSKFHSFSTPPINKWMIRAPAAFISGTLFLKTKTRQTWLKLRLGAFYVSGASLLHLLTSNF